MPEWKPGVLAGLLVGIEAAGLRNQRKGLGLITAAVEAKAKAELSRTSHRGGTRSPAAAGAPPALVTGTGRRSIGHQYVAEGAEPTIRIGTIANIFPPAASSTNGSRGSTPSSQYLYWQETLKRFDHPFLLPSFHSVVRQDAAAIWLRSFRSWPRI